MYDAPALERRNEEDVEHVEAYGRHGQKTWVCGRAADVVYTADVSDLAKLAGYFPAVRLLSRLTRSNIHDSPTTFSSVGKTASSASISTEMRS